LFCGGEQLGHEFSGGQGVASVWMPGAEREWLFAFVDEGDSGVEVGDFHDGEDRTEDFLLHDRRCGVDIGEHRRCDEQVVAVVLASFRRPAGIQQTSEPVEMPLVGTRSLSSQATVVRKGPSRQRSSCPQPIEWKVPARRPAVSTQHMPSGQH
jgi:hypothetical protein